VIKKAQGQLRISEVNINDDKVKRVEGYVLAGMTGESDGRRGYQNAVSVRETEHMLTSHITCSIDSFMG
jgi:hypothetical protein